MRIHRVQLMPYQKALLRSDNPFTFAVCGRGSGKTYTLSAIALIKLLQGENLILCAQRYDSLRDVLMKQVRLRAKEWGLENAVKFCQNPIRASYGPWTMYGTSYECLDGARGLDDINTILMDEVALAPLDVLDVLGPCLRGFGLSAFCRMARKCASLLPADCWKGIFSFSTSSLPLWIVRLQNCALSPFPDIARNTRKNFWRSLATRTL